MHASTESTTSEVRESGFNPLLQPLSDAPLERPYWEFEGARGPADLYRSFAFTALDQALKERGLVPDDDATYGLIIECVDMAVSVVAAAAGISDSWVDQYHTATAHLRAKDRLGKQK